MDKRAQDEPTLLVPGIARGSRPEALRLALRPDLLGAVHGRVRLVALLLLFAFVFDPLLRAGIWLFARGAGRALPADFHSFLAVDAVALAAAAASLGLWWAARGERLTTPVLIKVSLAYEVAICLVIAVLSTWHFYLDTGVLPQVTWVIGIIIFFPLVVPAPPRQVLVAALAAAFTPALGRWLLLRGGAIAGAPDYLAAVANPLLAAAFAYLGARTVHGLGRQAAAFRELGSYRLEACLGRGGMGEIWRARHRLLARPAAIKLIRPPTPDRDDADLRAELQARFEREAQVIAALRSPHTVTLFDFGVSTDGTFYYVMELLDGLDTDALVRRFGPQPPERVVHILLQVCHSLAEAEAREVVHRDIKPANIFLCRYGEDDDFVKVLDFGLAKVFDARQPDDEHLTGDNTVRGTPAFMAPEQARGETAIDTRADIYAVGCVAYWLLTGTTVFQAENAIGQIVAQATGAVEPPSARCPTPIPPALEALILACLEKDPEQRPRTVAALRDRLQASTPGDWTPAQARQWWTRHDHGGADSSPADTCSD